MRKSDSMILVHISCHIVTHHCHLVDGDSEQMSRDLRVLCVCVGLTSLSLILCDVSICITWANLLQVKYVITLHDPHDLSTMSTGY